MQIQTLTQQLLNQKEETELLQTRYYDDIRGLWASVDEQQRYLNTTMELYSISEKTCSNHVKLLERHLFYNDVKVEKLKKQVVDQKEDIETLEYNLDIEERDHNATKQRHLIKEQACADKIKLLEDHITTMAALTNMTVTTAVNNNNKEEPNSSWTTTIIGAVASYLLKD